MRANFIKKSNLYKFSKFNFFQASKDTDLIKRKLINNNIFEITLDSQSNKNALSKKLMDEMEENIDIINTETSKNRTSVRVVLLKSSVPKIFCAGADLKERKGMKEQDVKIFVTRLRRVFNNFSMLSVPTIACINGFALGGGLELSMACDIRLATKSSVLGLSETSLGIIPGAGGTQRLPRIVGVAKAKELIYTAAKLTADKSLSIGLINEVFENESDLNSKALEIANNIIKNAPLAIYSAKRAIDEGAFEPMHMGLKVEENMYDIVLRSEDREEGLKAFLEKRAPDYKGK